MTALHEYALVEEVLEKAQEHLEAERAKVVKAVVLKVGENSGYSVESLRQAYEMLKGGTKAEKAEMLIQVDKGNSVTLESIILEG
ncbi:MAG: hydrogenase maturation nickel metallochaperone HypA [Candidatus Thermoplasmatota archaeon]|nr:hydrogenase maturation nickel metallochaperone HypA [Candidatus Thermoplasmatota archaeon]